MTAYTAQEQEWAINDSNGKKKTLRESHTKESGIMLMLRVHLQAMEMILRKTCATFTQKGMDSEPKTSTSKVSQTFVTV